MRKIPLVLAMSLSLIAPLAAQPGGGQQGGQPPSLDQLHDALRLRPDQEQAWQVFQRASQPTPQDEARQRDAIQRMGTLHAPQRFDLSIQMMRADLEQMERGAGAMRTFYAALSPAQQAAFDRETAPPRQ